MSSKELILKDHQIDHYNTLMRISEKYNHYMDFSRMGTGKTYVTAKIAQMSGLKLFIVCPVSAANAWRQMSQYDGVDIVAIISYQSLRGTDRYPPNHGYLERDNEIKIDKKGNMKKKVFFTITDEFRQLIDEGILLVFDEGQNIKNASDQSIAARTLSGAIRKPSKCAFISGSPYDKEEHSENILRFLSILNQSRLIWSNPLTGEKVMKGMIDVIMFSKALDNRRTMDIIDEYADNGDTSTLTASKARSLCHNLFVNVIKDHLSSEMMPEESKYPLHIEESYIYLDEENVDLLDKAIQDLAQVTRFDGKDVDTKNIQWSNVTSALEKIEIIMVEPIAQFAKSILETKLPHEGHNKVIISVTHLETVRNLMDTLSSYNPIFVDGSIKDTARDNERTRRFNQFNTDPECRVLIATITTGGVSVSLHDTDGRYPRHTLLLPTYSILNIYQASGRIHRTGLKSDAYFYMVYGTNAESKQREAGEVKLTPILNALARKKDVLKGLIPKQSSIYNLPGEYPHKYYQF